MRLFERQRGEDRERKRRIARRAGIERIGDEVCLAETERQREDNLFSHTANNVFREGIRIGECLGHGDCACEGTNVDGLGRSTAPCGRVEIWIHAQA